MSGSTHGCQGAVCVAPSTMWGCQDAHLNFYFVFQQFFNFLLKISTSSHFPPPPLNFLLTVIRPGLHLFLPIKMTSDLQGLGGFLSRLKA